MLLADALIDSITSDWAKGFIHWFFEIMISILAVFLVLLVLVQRGRGGGIAGALGGMGGNSAFGTKAGDTFTWITYGTAAVWILLAMLTIKTFTDPPGDKARLARQKEEEESEPLSPLDIGSPTGEDDKASDDGKFRDEGAFFEKSSAERTAKERDTQDGSATEDSAKEEPATTTTDDAGDKPQPPEPDKAAGESK
jgi:preprotein translocase subunit SecG